MPQLCSARMRWAATCVAIALSGCSLGAAEETRTEPVGGAPTAIAATLEALEGATRRGDWRAICEDLFTPAARRRAGGGDCPKLLRSSAGDVRRPRIELLSLKLRRRRAEASVRTRTRGQRPLTDVIDLRRVRGDWRIESLR
jgi:hypothetical protein